MFGRKISVHNFAGITMLLLILATCTPSGKQYTHEMNNDHINNDKGYYGYDVAFLARNNIKTIQLKDPVTGSEVLIVPEYQGRVMTSSANDSNGLSFGWINYQLIESGKRNSQFNPFGGEERLWLGPEGGPYSVYFTKGKEQVYKNWTVPAEIDTIPFDVVSQDSGSVKFKKNFAVTNYSGNILNVGIEREVKLMTRWEIENALNLSLDPSLKFVAYQSTNVLTNNGKKDWDEKTGFLSLWLLSMFNPSEEGVVFIPVRKGSEEELGKIVNDDYFGKVPADRLKIRSGIIYFRTDGKFRSKIGISPQRALPFCGSYDAKNHVLTLLWYTLPAKDALYVNSRWGNQNDPLKGDVVNSYNDGPVEDGSVMGPFYEIESSSPAAILPAGGEISHTQRIFHIVGDEDRLDPVLRGLFDISIHDIKEIF